MNYEKIYNQLITKARFEDRKKIKGGLYYEAHHIIPKCMGGEGKAKDINHPNIILLTAKEHYIAHLLLHTIYPDDKKLRYALWAMINGMGTKRRYKSSARIYESLRKKLTHSQETREKMSIAKKGKPGHPTTSETIKKIIESRQGYIHDEKTRKKMSASAKNRTPASEETRTKMSKSHKGKIISTETKKRMSKPKSDEHRKNMCGRIISQETREKMSAKAKNRELLKRIKNNTNNVIAN